MSGNDTTLPFGPIRANDRSGPHFVPGGYPFLKDEVWFDAVRPYFSGNLIVGHDLLEL